MKKITTYNEKQSVMATNHTIPVSQKLPYYTPEIEEFHIGFEYEIFEDWDIYEEKTWHKQVFGKNGDDPEGLGYVHSDNLEIFRVKHIDREDCLSLGLKERIWCNGSGYFYMGNYTIGIHSIHLFCTVSQDDSGNNIMRFSGNLKNKSELKRVLQQVGCL